jgi:hypothetical protein
LPFTSDAGYLLVGSQAQSGQSGFYLGSQDSELGQSGIFKIYQTQ